MKQGSITVYLSLVMLVLLSLVTAGLYSARQAAGRVVLASGTEQALFSLFGQYDRNLYDRYGLLLLDGGYDTETLRAGALLEEVEDYASYIFHPKKGFSLPGGRDPIGVQMESSEDAITGYVLATDDGGKAFSRQVCELMQKKLGPAGLLLLQEKLDVQETILDAQREEHETYKEEQAEQYYQEDREQFGALPAPEEEDAEETVPDVINPLEAVHQMRASGVLAMVLPNAADISAAAMPDGEILSHRSLQQGMNMAVDGWEGSAEKLLLLEYIAEQFSCYTTAEKQEGLQYQIEYAIGGKQTDRENLQEVLVRLLTIREAANLIHLMRDPGKRAEADALATAISLLLLNPEAAPAISFALKVAWAYGESILDLQTLLEGNKIPLVKDAASWQLSLGSLFFLRTIGRSERHGSASGLRYEDYLRLLLCTKKADQLCHSAMDLVEWNLREQAGRSGFRLDTCLDALQVELHARIGRKEYQITRSYGYNA